MGSGRDAGNVCWSILWFLILVFVSFFVAGFCAFWYIVFYTMAACCEGLTGVADIMLKGVQFPHLCSKGMLSGRPIGSGGD